MSSDEEDNQMLIEELQKLQELQNAIQQKKNLRQNQSVLSDTFSNEFQFPKVEKQAENSVEQVTSYGNRDVEDEFYRNSSDNNYDEYSCENLQDLLDLNKKLMHTLTKSRNKMQLLLDECMVKKKIVQEQISKYSSSLQFKIISFNAGMPYFKDKNYYTAKMNDDTAAKINKGELRLAQLQRIHRWNQHDKRNLLKAIRHEVTLTLVNRTEPDENYIDNSIKKTSQLPQDVKKAIGSLGAIKLDWLKISNNIPDNKHSAEECEVMWNVFLHPDINKQKWSSKEDKELNQIVEEHNFQNWDAIAKDLKTNRSGYQCFIRYNTNNWKNLMKGQSWTPFDDKTLCFLVSKLRIGDYVPWGYIASCMNNWTKQQVYFRWNYSLAPHLKKGRFSSKEDEELMEAVEKYGPNFCKISALVMTNRTHIQLKEHYQTLKSRNNCNKKIWTYEDDRQLIALYQENGAQWSKIVKDLPDVNRVQARQRYKALMQFQKKGINLQNISRLENDNLSAHTTITFTTNTPWSRENKEILMQFLKVDEQLINYFKHENETRKQNVQSKVYTLKELEEDTKKLYNTLVKLNVNINLPEYIEDNKYLTEKYLELLSSLQTYKQNQNSNKKNIEHIRLKMFGHQEPVPENQRFIPPLPFNFCPPKNLRKQKTNSNIIDSPLHNEKQQIEFPLELWPNKDVNNCLGEDVEIQFEKLKKVIVTETGRKKSKTSLNHFKCKPFVIPKSFCKEADETRRQDIYTSPSRKRMKYDWELSKMIPTSSIVENTVETDSIPISIFEPCTSMLRTYQEVIFASSHFPEESEKSINQNFQLSLRGREALNMFKRRYQQLFHMPTGLSRIIPPDVVDESAFLPVLEKLKIKNNQKKNYQRKQSSIYFMKND